MLKSLGNPFYNDACEHVYLEPCPHMQFIAFGRNVCYLLCTDEILDSPVILVFGHIMALFSWSPSS